MKKWLWLIMAMMCVQWLHAQYNTIPFTPDGNAYYEIGKDGVRVVDPKNAQKTVFLAAKQLTPPGHSAPLEVHQFEFNADGSAILLFVNATKVWRYPTRGDYWVYTPANQQLRRVGAGLPDKSLQFAKFSPDGRMVAYVSGHNLYAESIAGTDRKQLTTDGNRKLINGTFDWAYEEEFFCRDGFRWSPDSRSIAYWQVDARQIRDYYMLNTIDSPYAQVIPVEYPKAGNPPSPVKIGVVSLNNRFTRWMQFEGDPAQHYITRMEWSGANELIVQRLNRHQQESKLIYCNTTDGSTRTFWADFNEAWIDLQGDDPRGWMWVNKGQDFLWVSEKDGWRHLYKISRDGKTVTLLTPGDYDIALPLSLDEANGYVYFYASPQHPVQQYLYRVKINTVQLKPEKVNGQDLPGTHRYQISRGGKIALHTYSSHAVSPLEEWVSLPDGRPLQASKSIARMKESASDNGIEYMQFATQDKVLVDAWVRKPANFNPNKKYPIVFYVYGEPWASTVADEYGNHHNFLYAGDMDADGYIQVSVDNRGSPSLKGASWRKSVYKKLGRVNVRDMAMAAKHIIQLPYVDKDRVAVWGWSGGGTSVFHLLFQYPDLFQTGIAIAPTARIDFYDNIYTERYMGLPQENVEEYIKGSAITYAHQLKGNLLIVHGTLDDNVHYSNTELMVNELIKHNKTFEVMPYPNRSHSLMEGEGTFRHLQGVYTRFLKKHCAPGAR
ncbi:MAG TPA: DPP IV N-terminal domain-containing protein [Ferruginibacter sp.]|nr:DPP IV N-terminal domain-containing protein [Ferruginibacter sp.]HRO18089.1 DPP IV N-terminal domain-containing protein [Ferruginibacter sp.]